MHLESTEASPDKDNAATSERTDTNLNNVIDLLDHSNHAILRSLLTTSETNSNSKDKALLNELKVFDSQSDKFSARNHRTDKESSNVFAFLQPASDEGRDDQKSPGGIDPDEIAKQFERSVDKNKSESNEIKIKSPVELAREIVEAAKNYKLEDPAFKSEISKAFGHAYSKGGVEAARSLANEINKNMRGPFGPVVFANDQEGKPISNGVDVQFFIKEGQDARPISQRLRVSTDVKDPASDKKDNTASDPKSDRPGTQKADSANEVQQRYERARMYKGQPMALTPKGDWDFLEPKKDPRQEKQPEIIGVELRDGLPFGKTPAGDLVPLVRKPATPERKR